ncbi:hypothetical protein [Candidatus Lariskella endosymbiont of Epinotia ramella]|uniref:hypothetical protein n=1 Tax=Candidatus Lariskella endosymbiont of Epinotia ramella TaxID=3066224 RepID=UPI0030CE77FD
MILHVLPIGCSKIVNRAGKSSTKRKQDDEFSDAVVRAHENVILESEECEITSTIHIPQNNSNNLWLIQDEIDAKELFETATPILENYRNNIILGEYSTQELLLLRDAVDQLKEHYHNDNDALNNLERIVLVELAKLGI